MALPKAYEFLKLGNKPPHRTDEKLSGKTVLITGATTGIGLATAHRFAQGNANLIFIVRNRQKAETLQAELQAKYGIKVVYYLADFQNLHSLKACLDKLKFEVLSLDILVNNAGVYSTKRFLTAHGTEMVLTVNHLASYLITETLSPLLEKKKGRIIQVNSEGHRFSGFAIDDPHFKKRRYTGLKSYGASKTAQLHTVWELAEQYKTKGITINAMHPGAVKSDIGMNNGWLYRTFKNLIINRTLKNVQDASDAIYYLVASKALVGVTGQYFYLTHQTMPAKHAIKSLLSKKITELTSNLLALALNK
jgi:NAD(P)-dependent dehydrogenase (short-subunit alcohol dehydrogenase family)